MSSFVPGDAVHAAGLGTGVVREVLNGNRYRIEIKGRLFVMAAAALEPVSGRAKPPRGARDSTASAPSPPSSPSRAREIDLHGMTIDRATAALDDVLDRALRDDVGEVRVIHGRSGGRLKAAVHARLAALPVVRSFRIDPSNPGVTVVTL